MRISDWSSDVCSSDLHVLLGDAQIEEPVGMARPEIVGPVGVGEIGGQHRDARVVVGEVGQLLAQDEGRQRRVRRAAHRLLVLEGGVPEGDVAARGATKDRVLPLAAKSEEHTSELQSLMRNSYDAFCLKKKKQQNSET